MDNKYDIAKDWLPRYTGMPVDKFGDYILLTNFQDYIEEFAISLIVMFKVKIDRCHRPANDAGLSIINFGIGSPNATINGFIGCKTTKRSFFLGKCGGLKDSSEIGNLFCLSLQLEVMVLQMIIFLLKFLLYLF